MSAYSKFVETQPNASKVTENPPADPKAAEIHFRSKLAFETDPSDVYLDLKNNATGIVVIDARTHEAYAQGHVPRAINLPYRKIDSSTTSGIPRDKVLVTYCDGVHCNASTKAALRLAGLGFHVKEMLDGMQGWKLEGYPVEERSSSYPRRLLANRPIPLAARISQDFHPSSHWRYSSTLRSQSGHALLANGKVEYLWIQSGTMGGRRLAWSRGFNPAQRIPESNYGR